MLVARRKPVGESGGLWEFPGGKVEPGERYREALVREFLEEFGVGLEVGRLICRVPFSNAGTGYRLYAFFAEPESDAFILSEHDEIRWLPLDEISRLELMDSDRRCSSTCARTPGLREPGSDHGSGGDDRVFSAPR